MSLLELREVGAVYGRRGRRADAVLKNVSLSFAESRFVALIGPNGSGKSTLLKVAAALMPYSGSVSLAGRELRRIRRSELGRQIGMMRQNIQVDATFSVYDLIALGRLPYKNLLSPADPADDARIETAARETGVAHLMFENAARLSGGETQRVLLAMLLTQAPQIYLLDEPSSAADIAHTDSLFRTFRRLASSGHLVVAALHDVNLAVRYADAFVALKDGAVLRAGDIETLDKPLLDNLYEADFEAFESQRGERMWHTCAV